MARALLIGGGGFVGAHLARALTDAGHDVLVADGALDFGNDPRGAAERTWREEHLLADVPHVVTHTADDGLSDLCAGFAPDAVVHLANLPLPAAARRSPGLAHDAIVTSTATVLGAVRASAPQARLVYISSSMVYGHFTADPQPEDAELKPLGEYGRCKLAAELLVRAENPAAAIVRPSAVYGPGDGNGRLLQRLVDAATGGPTLVLTASPSAASDYTWVGDLAAGLMAACFSPAAAGGTYNVTAGRARTVADAIAIVRDLGYDPDIQFEEPETGRPDRGALSITRARDDLCYQPAVTFEEGIARYLESHVTRLAAAP